MPSPALLPHARIRRMSLGLAGLALATWALIVFGALVRANGAGLACPDWPLCFGELVPSFDFRVALEWGHRVLAGAIGIGYTALGVALLRAPDLRESMRLTVILGFVLLAVQVGLGGLTVLLGLAPWTVTAHLVCGNLFLVLLVWMWRDLRESLHEDASRETTLGSAGFALVAGSVALVGVQIVLGGLVSSHYAGFACWSFPTCDGTSFAPTLRNLVGLHVLHRFGAYAVALAYLVLVFAVREPASVASLARSGLRLVVLQIAVGALNVLLRMPVELTALHSAVASGLVVVTALLGREALRRRAPAPAYDRARMAEAR